MSIADPKLWAFLAMAIAMFSAPWLVPRLLLGFDTFIPADLAAQRLAGAQPPLVVDVRSKDEFILPPGHIKQALNWPVATLTDRLQDTTTAPPHDRAVLLICESDWRASTAARAFRDAGYQNLHVIAGGMRSWQAHQLPLAE